ncbi:MAG TPA: serine/threonine-protein kinase [Vicinamibacteria bacterium]|nr:serine/threonine-protein kinase [Vicinamibacteria bacterium]
MPLAAGNRLGPYAIVGPIGKGGMGDVYRARDTKLDRDVAIKVLPEELAADEERVARFQREAKLLASLNHPNIAAIYGLEESDGVKALVLELVEGSTLAERIREGAIPVEEAVAIAKQIAEALEAGHEVGVIHRDLKPANIKLKEDDTVKVLDYGLAKALEREAPSGGDAELSQSPTRTRQGTQVGVILGTAAYMSPEQAKGKRVDKRADVWAFGAVLYEMLAGKRAFAGNDVSETLAHVMMKDPDWEALPPETPGALRQVLRLCLVKDAKRRVRDIADVRLTMEGEFETEAESSPGDPVRTSRRPSWAVAVALALALATATGVAVRSLEPEASRPISRLAIPLPAEILASGGNGRHLLALSPDGSRLVVRNDATNQLYLRAMDQRDVTLVPGTEDALNPFFSPDSESVAFWADGELKKVALGRTAAVTICEAEPPFGARWNADDTIVFGQTSGIFRASANGGAAEVLVSMEGTGKVAHGPQVLPGGNDVLVTLGDGGDWDNRVRDSRTGSLRSSMSNVLFRHRCVEQPTRSRNTLFPVRDHSPIGERYG